MPETIYFLKEPYNSKSGAWVCLCIPEVWWWWQLHPHWWSWDTELLTGAHQRCRVEYLQLGNPVVPSRRPAKTAWSFLNWSRKQTGALDLESQNKTINTALTNLLRLSTPFFFGPLQITASSGLLRRKPIDITAKLSSTYCNKHAHRRKVSNLQHWNDLIRAIKLKPGLVWLTTGDQPEPLWWTYTHKKINKSHTHLLIKVKRK